MEKKDTLGSLKAILLVLGSLVAGYMFIHPGYMEREPININVPPAVLDKVGGGKLNLASLAGKPYLLEVWELNCPHCRREIPVLNELQRSGQLQVVSLIYEPSEEQIGEKELQELCIEYPVYRIRDGLLNKLELVAFPTAYLVNSSGVATERIVGAKDNGVLKRITERTIEKE